MGARRGGGGGKSRPSPRPPSKIKKNFWHYWGPFCYFFFMWRPFCYVFLIFGGLFTMWGPFCYVLLHGGDLFLRLPPHPTKISVGAHDCKEGSRACSREMFLCDHNLVSSGHVLLRFCLKNDKNMINCSHVPASWV